VNIGVFGPSRPRHSAEGRFDAGVAGTPRRAFFAECCPRQF